MFVMSSVLSNDVVKVSQNEPYCYHTLNSNFKKLIENDQQIYDAYKSIYSGLDITDYQPARRGQYDLGQLVWWQDQNHNNQLYLLKNVIQNNPYDPHIPERITGDYEASQYLMSRGWYNENSKLTILNLGIKAELSSLVDSHMQDHQNDSAYHPYGKIDGGDLDKCLLRQDLSNVDPDRPTTFYPNRVFRLEAKRAVVHGYYKVYDCGLLEYDIIFSFSPTAGGVTIFDGKSDISANSLALKTSGGSTLITRYDNRQYFYNSSYTNIFTHAADPLSGTAKIGQLTQRNRNNYVNVYSATINFPKPFGDRNYMIFSNMVLSQADKSGLNSGTVVPSANEIVFCNKALDSVTAINVTYPNSEKYSDMSYNAVNGGLAANSFHCKIIGRGEG